jgi:ABC-2 type transport system permease protein
MNPRNIFLYLHIFALGYLRSRIGLFFSLVFPVILILLFGAIFSSSGSSAINIYVQNQDHNSPISQKFIAALNETGAFNVNIVSPSSGNLSTWLSNNGDTAGIVIPAGFAAQFMNHTPVRVTVYTDPAQGATAGTVQGVVQGVVNEFNLGGTPPVITVRSLNVGSTSFQYIDYLVPGLIGFTVLTSPMFATVNISSEFKKYKLFRQLSLTPLTRGEWLTAAIIWFIVLTAISTVLMVSIGELVYGAKVTLTLLAVPFLVLGPLFFVSLGLVAGSATNSPESAAVIGNLITFPMMFLSGTFFPVSMFPSWLQDVAFCLPLYYVIDGLNNAMVFGNVGRVLVDLTVIVVLAIVTFIAAIHLFKWREK